MRARDVLVVSASLAALVATSGCQRETYERVVHQEDHLSIRALPEWTHSRTRGSLVFVGPAGKSLERTTIVLRSVKYDGRSAKRTHEDLLRATRTVLDSMPSAQVEPFKASRGSGFAVQFRARKNKKLYERRHVVVKGHEYAFHVMLTAPIGTLTKEAQKTLEQVVDSLREEVRS